MNCGNKRFTGKVAIVTGAGAGIGLATAELFAREGARVIAVDILADRLDALQEKDQSGNIVTVCGDILKEDTIRGILSIANERIDILANIVGIMDGFLPAAEVDDATWDRVIAVNVTSIMRLTRAVLPFMVAFRTKCPQVLDFIGKDGVFQRNVRHDEGTCLAFVVLVLHGGRSARTGFNQVEAALALFDHH